MIEVNNIRKKYCQNYSKVINGREIRSIGEWRKGVAIGYATNPIDHHSVPYLINKSDEILYEGYSCCDYAEEIYRTSKGYYIVTGYRDTSAPGKDSHYSGPYIRRIIDEDGRTVIHKCNVFYDSINCRWYDPNDEDFFIPREMGMGIVEYNGSFFRLDNFEKLFEIPQQYKIESIFEKGVCLLSVPQDNREFFVLVKNKEIVDYFDVNNENKLFKLINKTGNLELINYNNNEDSIAIRIFKEQKKNIDEKEEKEKRHRLEKINYYSSNTYPRHYISEDLITVEEFKNGITLCAQEIKLLQKLHKTLCKEDLQKKERISFHLRENKKTPDNCLECFFFSNFLVLRMNEDYGKIISRFYSLNGHALSSKLYYNVGPIRKDYPNENQSCFSNHYFVYKHKKDSGIIIISGGTIIENPYPDFMFDKDRFCYNISVHENYISFKNEYYDFSYRKIPVNYTDVKLETVVKNYLYKMYPDFEVSMYCDEFVCGHVRCMLGGFMSKEKFMHGSIYKPLPSRLESIMSELSYRYRNIPNHVSGIKFIGDYEDEVDGAYSIYLFNCRPHAYCNTEGHIFYDFKPNEVML